MKRDIDRGICEHGGCEQPIAYVVRWDKAGASEPAFACADHAFRRRSIDLEVQKLSEYEAERRPVGQRR